MDPPTPDSSPPSSPEPPPWAVPWEGEGGPLPVLVGVAAPVLLRGETERLLRDLGRSRPLPPSLRHLKRVRGGPGGAAGGGSGGGGCDIGEGRGGKGGGGKGGRGLRRTGNGGVSREQAVTRP